MKKLLACLLAIVPFLSDAQSADSTWIVTNYTKQEVYIPMRDGVKLFTAIYKPKDKTVQHPFLITRTPYSCAPYGANTFAAFWKNPRKAFLEENYIYVQQDVRGRWMSEGNFVDVRPHNPNKTGTQTDESSDSYDTIDWLLKNIDNNNGKVGVFGTSYPGFYSTMAALSNHPALKAVSPQAPVTDWFIGDDFHHNGAFMLMDAFAFYSSFGKPRPQPTTVGPTGFPYPTADNYEFYLRTGPLPAFSKLMGDSIAFWKDLMNHTNHDAWWKARNARAHVQNIAPHIATLVVGGLYDAEDCFGAWRLYEAIEAKTKNDNKIVMGPWYHGQWGTHDGTFLGNVQWGSNTSDWYQRNIEVPFFNYHLYGKGSLDQQKEASIFFSGANEWKQFTKWPAPGMQMQDWYFHKDGHVSKVAPTSAGNTFDAYISDPAKPVPYTEDVHFQRTAEYMTDDQRFAARRPDVLVYQTPVLTEDLTLAGPLVANLRVSLTGTDADFVVKLIDVFPDDFRYEGNQNYTMNGYQMLVRGEVMRGKYRNSFEQPQPFVPNQPTQVSYTLPDVAHTFKKGHRLMIQVQSSWFPLVDRNPQQFMNIYQANPKDFQKATIRFYHKGSSIKLPVLL